MTSIECARINCPFYDRCPARSEANCLQCYRLRRALSGIEDVKLVSLEAWR